MRASADMLRFRALLLDGKADEMEGFRAFLAARHPGVCKMCVYERLPRYALVCL